MKRISSQISRSRRRARRSGAVALAALASLFAAAAGYARPVPAPEPVVVPVSEPEPTASVAQRGGRVSLEQAIAMAQSRYRGRVVRAEPTTRDGRTVYEIRILGEDGRVRNVRIDAQSGRFL